MMTPRTNLADHGEQINQYAYLNSIPTCDKLKLIRKPKVLALTCMSKSTLHLRIIDLTFPPSISLGDRAVAFVEHEVLAVIAAQIQGKSKEELRVLIKVLIAHRQHLAQGVTL